jgi:hypothetical protein
MLLEINKHKYFPEVFHNHAEDSLVCCYEDRDTDGPNAFAIAKVIYLDQGQLFVRDENHESDAGDEYRSEYDGKLWDGTLECSDATYLLACDLIMQHIFEQGD